MTEGRLGNISARIPPVPDSFPLRCWLAGVVVGLGAWLIIACGTPAPDGSNPTAALPNSSEGRLQVVATTTIVGDVVRAVGGDAIALTVLLPPGVDPHTFEPTPQDVAAVADAAVVFANGAGLEGFLEPLLQNAGGEARLVFVSEGIAYRRLNAGASVDPHVWFDPLNVLVWVQNIEEALRTLDPTHAEVYVANAQRYRTALRELDAWIRDQVARVPPERRRLVTDHAVFGYFADRYGFAQVGAIVPGMSSAAEPSAQELAALEDAIRRAGVPAIFVGATVNPNLAQRIAEDVGVRVVFLYTGSLSPPGGPADSYLKLMRYNVSAIVDALTEP